MGPGFDSLCSLLTSLVVCSLFLFRAVSQFRDELAAVEADSSNPHPAPPDTNVARFNIPLPNPGLSSALGAFRAKVMRLQFHIRSTINVGWFWGRSFFRKTNRYLVLSDERNQLARYSPVGTFATPAIYYI